MHVLIKQAVNNVTIATFPPRREGTSCIVRDCAKHVTTPVLKIPSEYCLGVVSPSKQKDFNKRFRKKKKRQNKLILLLEMPPVSEGT